MSAHVPAAPPAQLWRSPAWSRKIGAHVLRLFPISLYRRLLPRPVIGLCYHVVSDRALAHVEHLYPYKTPEQFERDLIYVKRNFQVLSYPELCERMASRQPAPSNAVVLSFDDGMAECYSVARPLLQKHGLPCIFFINPEVLDNRRMYPFDRASLCIGRLKRLDREAQNGIFLWVEEVAGERVRSTGEFARWITRWMRSIDAAGERILDVLCERLGVDTDEYLRDQRPYLTREQVRQMDAEGFTIGGHALRHVALGSLARPDEVEHEIVESCRGVADLVGRSRVPFAFPYDADSVDRGLLERLLARHPFVGPLFDTRRLARDREFMVNRMIVDTPPRGGGRRSNLPSHLRSAYLSELQRSARYLLGLGRHESNPALATTAVGKC